MTHHGMLAAANDWISQRLQRQFALIAATLVIASSAVFLLLVTHEYRANMQAAYSTASLNVNLLLQGALENAMLKRDLPGLQQIVARLGKQDGVRGVTITNPAGEVRFASDPERIHQQLGEPRLEEALTRQEPVAETRLLPDGHNVLRSINPVPNQPPCQTCHGPMSEHPVNGLLVVDYDISQWQSAAWQGALLLGVSGVVVLLLLEVGLWIALSRLVLRRIDRLSFTTRQIAAGALSERTGIGGRNEIAALGRSLNDMASQLEARERELRASEAFLQSLIDAIPDGVRVIGPDFRLRLVNRAFCRQIGANPEDVAGQPCYAVSHKRTMPCVPTLTRCPVVELLQDKGNDIKFNDVHVDRAGSDLSVEVSAAVVPMLFDGQETRCVVESIRDLEAELSISQQQRLSEMGMLAAGVAHEVYNPLSSISLALRTIRARQCLSPENLTYIDIAEAEIANCQTITDSLLRLAAPPRNAPELVDLGRVVHETLALLRLEAEQHGVTVVENITGRPRVLATDGDMRVLIFNLALNAIHAMPEGGELRVSLDRVDDMVRISVADTGVGIPERDQARIMLPFWTRRADGSRGRGLGLTISSTIIRHLGGDLRFDSQVGKGTCFVITLPDAGEAPE